MPQTATRAPRLLIVGSSTRAAAWSAIRAGYFPLCADQFADLDLRQVAKVLSVQNYPHSLPEDLADISSDAWLFTGAMERYPDVLARLRQMPRLGIPLGCHDFTLSPHEFTEAARSAGLSSLELWAGNSHAPPANGTWMRKIHPGGGGLNVRVWDESAQQEAAERGDRKDSRAPDASYFQRKGCGVSGSALFELTPVRATEKTTTGCRIRFLGATRQLIGHPASAPPSPFVYCGNLGPVTLPAEAIARLRKMLSCLASQHALAGIVGIDFLSEGDNISPVELNPRYTAACEILELAGQRPLLPVAEVESRACDSLSESSVKHDQREHRSAAMPHTMLGKLILYADRPVQAPDFQRFLKPRSPWAVPFLADIPAGGTLFRVGAPLCTIFARGTSAAQVEQTLIRRADRVRQWFF